MEYICYKRFKQTAICGSVNITYGTELEAKDGIIYHYQNQVCYTTSQNAYDYFAINDDGKGIERGKLTADIISTLAKRDAKHQARWDKVWADLSLLKYKRPEHADHWLWNHDFYCAPIADLERIKQMIQEV
jgi:hypothetical protein